MAVSDFSGLESSACALAVFSKLGHLLRKTAARDAEALYAAIAQSLKAFTPQECANYFKNAGYLPT